MYSLIPSIETENVLELSVVSPAWNFVVSPLTLKWSQCQSVHSVVKGKRSMMMFNTTKPLSKPVASNSCVKQTTRSKREGRRIMEMIPIWRELKSRFLTSRVLWQFYEQQPPELDLEPDPLFKPTINDTSASDLSMRPHTTTQKKSMLDDNNDSTNLIVGMSHW